MQVRSVIFLSNVNFNKNWRQNKSIDKPSFNFVLQKTQKPASIAIQEQKEEEFFQFFLNRKGKVTKKEYEEIIKKHPSVIIKAQKLIEKEKPTHSTPKQIALAALKLKEKYDDEYNGNYTIASIGTSPALICEVMQALGSKVVFIPATKINMLKTSKLYVCRNQYPTTASRLTNVNFILKYAKKSGIDRKSNEFLILLDYCHSGRSLDNLCNLFIEENLFNPEKMHDRSITSDLSEVSNFKNPNSTFRLEDLADISRDMKISTFEAVSNTPHFHVYEELGFLEKNAISSEGKSERELFRELDEFSQPLARAFSLCAIHEALKLQNYIS